MSEILVLSKPYNEAYMVSGHWTHESEPVMVKTKGYNFLVDENGDWPADKEFEYVEGESESPAVAFWGSGHYCVFWTEDKIEEAKKLVEEGSELGVLMVAVMPLAVFPDGETEESSAEDWMMYWYNGSLDTVEKANAILAGLTKEDLASPELMEAKGFDCTTI